MATLPTLWPESPPPLEELAKTSIGGGGSSLRRSQRDGRVVSLTGMLMALLRLLALCSILGGVQVW